MIAFTIFILFMWNICYTLQRHYKHCSRTAGLCHAVIAQSTNSDYLNVFNYLSIASGYSISPSHSGER